MTAAHVFDLWENGTQRDRRTVAGPTVSTHPSLRRTRGDEANYGIVHQACRELQ
jgi:hypothetical protein